MTDPIQRLKGELVALDAAYSPGHHGLWSARRRSELIDAALEEHFSLSDPPPRTALIAAGGYARREQLPASDIDLVVIHDGIDDAPIAAFAERFLYPLWDAGFTVGHSVLTLGEAEAAARARLDTETSLWDARYLAGDPGLATTLADRLDEAIAADRFAARERLVEGARVRHERFGSAAHLLEPDVKEGEGGLRDVATIAWLQRVAGRELLTGREREVLAGAHEFLTRVRSALHLETGRRADRLVADHQRTIAASMGFEDEPRLPAVDGAMRALFEHARQVAYLLKAAVERSQSPGSVGDPGTEPVPAPIPVPTSAAELLTIFAHAAGEGRPPSATELDGAAAADPPAGERWDAPAREAFMRILRAGEAGIAALEALDRLGLLARLLPAWGEVRCRPQRDPYHRFTVDVHLLDALGRMSSLLAGDAPEPEDPVAIEARGQVTDTDALLLGAFFHDIGKNGEGGHVAVGARVVAEMLDLIGVVPPTRDLTRFLVEQHLLLPDTATRRDLTDDELVLDVAESVGTPERLAALYLLVVADAGATGPAAWTPWRRTLIRELVAKVQRVFDRGDMGVEVAERLTERIDRLRQLLIAEPSRDVERHILRMPRSYFLSVDPEQASRHFPTISPDVGATEVRSAAVAGAQPATYELLVVAADRSGLLSWIAGSLALAGLSILTAQAFTTDDRVAVDLFEVAGIFEEEVDESRWREFRATLRKAIEGRTSLEHRVAAKRARYPGPRRYVPVTVTVDNDASDFFTVIEVGTSDRIGLLYDVTRTLADLELDVHLAKIATYADRVIDAFYVRDVLGGRVDQGRAGEISTAIRTRLAMPDPDQART